jgi:hypothetical protein
MDFGPDHEHESDDITLYVDIVSEKVAHDLKPYIKGKMLRMQEPVREEIDEKLEKAPKYEMMPRKFKISIDLNKPVAKEEQGLKDGSKVNTLVKTKVEYEKEMDDNNQVQVLKQKNVDMEQHIQTLQQQKQDLELQHTKIQKKYHKLQKKHQKTFMFLKEII